MRLWDPNSKAFEARGISSNLKTACPLLLGHSGTACLLYVINDGEIKNVNWVDLRRVHFTALKRLSNFAHLSVLYVTLWIVWDPRPIFKLTGAGENPEEICKSQKEGGGD